MDDMVVLPSREALPILHPGHKLFLERSVAGQDLRTSVALVGVKPGRFLIIEQPVFFRGTLFSAVGCDCVVRLVHQGMIYGFTTEVLHLQRQPWPLVYLAYPPMVERVNLRSEERYPVQIRSTIYYRDVDDFQSVTGMMTDLSLSGCRIDCPLFIDRDEGLELSFRLDDRSASDRLPALVRHYRRQVSGVFEYGVMFRRPAPAVRDYLRRLDPSIRKTVRSLGRRQMRRPVNPVEDSLARS